MTDAEIARFSHSPTATEPCLVCGRLRPENGHDPCLGELPGVEYACCGHGGRDGYIIFSNNLEIRFTTRLVTRLGESYVHHTVVEYGECVPVWGRSPVVDQVEFGEVDYWLHQAVLQDRRS